MSITGDGTAVLAPTDEGPTTDPFVPVADAEAQWEALGRLVGDRDIEDLTPDELVDLALAVPHVLAPDVRHRIVEFRRRAPAGDVLLLRGFLPDHVSIPPTPASSSLPVTGPAQRVAVLLAGVMTMFGEPFTYESLWDGRLVANLVPVPSMKFTQTSQSSEGLLDWHVEDGYRDDRCDHVGLICLRGDPGAASQYAQAKDLRLPAEIAAMLRQERFQLCPDPAHVLPDDMPKRRIAVLTGPEAEPEIVYDTHHIEPIDGHDQEAADALAALHTALGDVRIAHVMERGDLLVFDNKRVVHSRTPFTARFDGTDRWLMRVMACGNVVTFRRWGHRITQ